MISCKREHLLARCRQRGYTLDEVQGCVVGEDGDQIAVDENHPAYPRAPKPGFFAPVRENVQLPQAAGPGTELKKLLKKVGIEATPTCSCNARACLMDERGIEWCENNLDEIVGWLREEATKRKLPFVDMAGRMLVRRAIRNAKRA